MWVAAQHHEPRRILKTERWTEAPWHGGRGAHAHVCMCRGRGDGVRVSSGSRVKMRSDSPHPSPNNPIPSLVASVPTPDTRVPSPHCRHVTAPSGRGHEEGAPRVTPPRRPLPIQGLALYQTCVSPLAAVTGTHENTRPRKTRLDCARGHGPVQGEESSQRLPLEAVNTGRVDSWRADAARSTDRATR